MTSNPKFKKEFTCNVPKGTNPVADKFIELAASVHAMGTIRKGAGNPHLFELQKVPGTTGTWKLMFEGLSEENYAGVSRKQLLARPRTTTGVDKASAESFNRRLTTIGKKIFGKTNFTCDAGLAPDGNGTGMIVMNWSGITTCKITVPDEPIVRSGASGGFLYQGNRVPGIKMLDHAEKIDITWKDAISPSAKPTGIEIRNAYDVGYHDSDIHEITEAYYWEWCKD